MPENGCPSVDELSRFIERTAPAAAREQILVHLDTCDTCRLLLAATLRDSQFEQQSGMVCSPRTFPVGEVVGARYRVVRLIARGGMGEVYEARDLQLSESVALKTIACTGLDNAALYVRIRKEVQLARKVTHANVCRILEFGLHQQVYRDQQETIPFFTMELLDGETLADYISRSKTLSLPELLPIAVQIAQGLSAIHAAGIVHRDLKPENIFLLTQATGCMRAVVMDFGLARNQDTRGSMNESSSNSAVGTPSYMAPEQSLGSTPTVAWDIFAFGVILFRVITGELPFKGNTAVALAMARLREPAPKLSSLVPDVDPALENLVARCLQREPAHRFATVTDVEAALADLRLRPVAARSRLPLLVVVLIASAVAAAIGGWVFDSPPQVQKAASRSLDSAPSDAPRRSLPPVATAALTIAAGTLSTPPPAFTHDTQRALGPSGHTPAARPEAGNVGRQPRARQAAATTDSAPVSSPAVSSTTVPKSGERTPAEDEIAIPIFAGPPRVRSGGEK